MNAGRRLLAAGLLLVLAASTGGNTLARSREPRAELESLSKGESIAGFRVEQTFLGASSEVTGRTAGVTGTATSSGDRIESVESTIDLLTLTSDGKEPAPQFAASLETTRFPQATVRLTEPISLGAGFVSGARTEVTATGELTLHGVTRTVTATVTARRDAAGLAVTGTGGEVLFVVQARERIVALGYLRICAARFRIRGRGAEQHADFTAREVAADFLVECRAFDGAVRRGAVERVAAGRGLRGRRRRMDGDGFERGLRFAGRSDGCECEQADGDDGRAMLLLDAEQRHQGQNATLAVIVDAHREQHVFDGRDDEQRPQHQRQRTEHGGRVRRLARGAEDGLEGVKRARSDITEHDTECGQAQ